MLDSINYSKNMKLRIKGNSIRFRLTQSEVAAFGTVGQVKEAVNFGNQDESDFFYAVERNSTRNLSTAFEEGKLKVSVPKDTVNQWVNTEQVGIEGEDGDLRILIEKDFVCPTPRKGEDEHDNFPHPK